MEYTLQDLRQLVAVHGWRGAASLTGIAKTSLRNWLKDGREPSRWQPVKKKAGKRQAATIVAPTEPAKGWEARLLDELCDLEDVLREGDTEVDCAEIRIDSALPIGIAFPADWHTGNQGTRHSLIRRVLGGILSTPFMFCCADGDVVDGFVALSHETGRFEQIARPRHQKQIIAWIMKSLQSRLLAVAGGQHEFFEERVSDFDAAEYFARQGRAAYLGAGGVLELTVGEQPYRLGMWHKYKGTSQYDPTAAAKRCFRDHGPFDVTVTADKHSPAISYCELQSAWSVFVQCGTCKLADRYAKSLGFSGLNPEDQISTPVVILWPDKRKFWVTLDFEEGCRYLKYLRGRP